jgi:WD40 repeat protein
MFAAVALCLAWAATVHGQGVSQTPELKLNQPLERELVSGETDKYQVTLEAGEFLQVHVEQRGIDVVLSIHSADAKSLTEIDNLNGADGLEILSFIAGKGGSYFVQISRLNEGGNAKSGPYSITLVAKRASTAKDREIIETELKFRAVAKARGRKPDELKEDLKRLLVSWRGLSEKPWVALVLELIDSRESLEEAAGIYEEFGSQRRAQHLLEKLAKKYYDELAWDQSRATLERALELAKKRKDAEAAGRITSTIKRVIKRKQFESDLHTVGAMVVEGQRLSYQGKKSDAMVEFNKAVEFCRNNKHLERVAIDIYEMIGQTHLELGKVEDAKKTYRVALDYARQNEFVGYEIQYVENLQRIEREVPGSQVRVDPVIQTGHTDNVTAVAFSPKGKILVSGGSDSEIKLWDVASGKELRALSLHRASIRSVAFSSVEDLLATASDDGTVMLWNALTGIKIRTISVVRTNSMADPSYDDIISGRAMSPLTALRCVTFSPDGRILASADNSGTVRLWDKASGELINTLEGHRRGLWAVEFSPDGHLLASAGNDRVIRLWDVTDPKNATSVKEFAAHQSAIFSLRFGQDGKLLVSGGADGLIKFWSVEDSKNPTLIKEFQALTRKNSYGVRSIDLSYDGKRLVCGSEHEGVKLWDVTDAKNPVLLKTFSVDEYGHEINAVAFSPDGALVASGNSEDTIDLLDGKELKRLKTLARTTSDIKTVNISANLKSISVGHLNSDVSLWDLGNLRKVKTFDSVSWPWASLNLYRNFNDEWNVSAISGDGSRFAVIDRDSIQVADVETGKTFTIQIKDEDGADFQLGNLALSPSGDKVAALYATRAKVQTRLWSVEDAKELSLPSPEPDWVKFKTGFEIREIKGKEVLIYPDDAVVKFIYLETGELYASLFLLPNGEWAVVDAQGRWDASDGAQKLMYYTLSTPEGYEIIEFSQLKERYYEPKLLQKLLGHNKETLKDVAQFKDVLIPPAIEPLASNDNKSTVRQVKLRNRGGGIGRVQVFVNGREVIIDARDAALKANPDLKEYVLAFDFNTEEAPINPGQQNDVKVIAWNYDAKAKELYKGYISSREAELVYLAPEAEVGPPTLYAIIAGVSDYKGDPLDLQFAAKDAGGIYKAVQVGGKNLFGVERMKLKLLSTGNNKDAILPTKENFRKAFEEFSREAKPNDVLFVYLSGHGITLNSVRDTYYFLTQGATTTDKEALSKDSELLSLSTINSEELTQWHKSIKAQKQVLILDTCAAGAFGNEFKVLEKKEVSSDAIRALVRMQGRIGFHVLMGSAADSASFEASQYGQGLLTYALLQGMKGPALLQDGQVDVSRLFNYPADTVPDLARNVGGIQRPEIRVPSGGLSFAIGLIASDADKSLIPLAQLKPIIISPRLHNKALDYDDQELEMLLRRELRKAKRNLERSGDASIVYVETDEMGDAYQPRGSYTLSGDYITVTIRLIRNNVPGRPLIISGRVSEKDQLVKQIVAAVFRAEIPTQAHAGAK